MGPNQLNTPYPSDEYYEKDLFNTEDILVQQQTHDIKLDIQATLETLINRINPTNNHRLGLVIVLLQAAAEAADYITQPERVPRSFSGKSVLQQEKTALQISDYYSYFESTLKGICNHFDTPNENNNYIPNPIGRILHKTLFSINTLLITEGAFVEVEQREHILSEHLDRRQFLTPR
ncbi:12071_t:CDS:1, partial [Racocetra persica]